MLKVYILAYGKGGGVKCRHIEQLNPKYRPISTGSGS